MSENLLSKCPNCGAARVLSMDKRKIICNYCDTEFPAPHNLEENKEKKSNSVSPARKLFQFTNLDTFGNEGNKTWEFICACLNSETSINKYHEYLEEITKNNSDIAMQTLNTELLDKIFHRVSSYLFDNEKLIFYKDSGLFSKGKEGILITNKRIFFLKKNNILFLRLKDIKSLEHPKYLHANSWFFNGYFNDCTYVIDSIACTDKQLGIIIAFICKMAQNLNSDNYKIIVRN